MATLPDALALTTIADDAQVTASPHRNNYTGLQAAFNALRTILAGGTSGQVLQSAGGTTISWADQTGAGTELDYKAVTAAPAAITATTEATAVAVITGNTTTYDGSKVKVEFFFPGCSTAVDVVFVVLRDSTIIGQVKTNSQGGDTGFDGSFYGAVFDTPAAGTHTYEIAAYTGGGQTLQLNAGAGGSGNLVPAFLRVTKA